MDDLRFVYTDYSQRDKTAPTGMAVGKFDTNVPSHVTEWYNCPNCNSKVCSYRKDDVVWCPGCSEYVRINSI